MCKEKKMLLDYPEVVKLLHLTLNSNVDIEKITHKSHQKLWWFCPTSKPDHVHETEVQSVVSAFLSGNSGCPYCHGKRVCFSNSLAFLFPIVAKMWHPNLNIELNNNLKPEDVTPFSRKKAFFQCLEMGDIHSWKGKIGTVVRGFSERGSYCPFCSGKKLCIENSLAYVNPEVAKEWDFMLNYITPFDVTASSTKKIWWKCKLGHSWKTSVVGKRRCPYCSGARVSSFNALDVMNSDLADQWDYYLNFPMTPNMVSYGSNKNFYWICPKNENHVYLASPAVRTTNGCPFCSGHQACHDNCLATRFPEIAAEWHQKLNGDLTAKKVTPGSDRYVYWQCQKEIDHVWRTTIYNRTCGNTGCPYCKESKGEKAIRFWLNKNNIIYCPQCHIDNFYFDFIVYYDDKPLIIEFQGHQHYSPVSFGSKKANAAMNMFEVVVLRDVIKRLWCQEKNIRLFEIPYWEIKKIPHILTDFLSGRNVAFSDPPQKVLDYANLRNQLITESIQKYPEKRLSFTNEIHSVLSFPLII